MRLVIHAPNVHRGGGKTLLADLLREAQGKVEVLALVDRRIRLDVPNLRINLLRFAPTIAGRIGAELSLKKNVQSPDVVLCFGNLPPLFKLSSRRNYLFLQNRYLLDGLETFSLQGNARWRVMVEKFWLRRCLSHIDTVLVQSRSMAEAALRCLDRSAEILPFTSSSLESPAPGITKLNVRSPKDHPFLYVASGEPHKNHRRLIEAWTILAKEGIKPRLQLTLDRQLYRDLVLWIEHKTRENSLLIENLGEVGSEKIQLLYDSACALIYPSLAESLGLPLLEAVASSLPVIASERDFVRDNIEPDQTFDPESALSIARAVRRFSGLTEARPEIMKPGELIARLLSG